MSKLYLGYGGLTWKKNDKHIVAWAEEECLLGILGRSAPGSNARNAEFIIDFGDDAKSRQENLLEMRAALDELIEANAAALEKLEEEKKREDAYKKELLELLRAQQREKDLHCEDLTQKHEQELAAVKEQLRKKYEIDK